MIDGKKGRVIKEEEEEIKIDYENIDVADIMEQIKRRIAKRPKKPLEEIGKEELRFTPPDHIPLEPEEATGIKSKIKRLLLKIMKPFSPLIKLCILPVYQEFREAFLILDQTNKRLEFLAATFNEALSDINQRIDHASDDLGKTMEYTKLLHNLSHNIVVELSKLKIEAENLKLKTRIMEKDFEFLGKRERTLEKQIFR